MMQVLILAGGLGTRMRPATDRIPKALLPVANRPFAAWQLELLTAGGIEEIVYGVGHLGSQIEDYLQDGSRWGVSIRYSYEQDELLGTGGAIRLAVERGMLRSPFFVMYGDSYLPIRYADVATAFASCGRRALMIVYPNQDRWEKSNACYVDGVIKLYDKGRSVQEPPLMYVDYGLSILTQEAVLEYIPQDTRCDLADTFRALSVAGQLAGYVAADRFYEIGSPAGVEMLEKYLSLQETARPNRGRH